MIYLQLFWSFFKIGLFSFGGGYATMPLIQNQVVEQNHWLTMNEFINLITISQVTPGPIAINSAAFVGIRIAGILGAVVATVGCVLPACIIILILSMLYFKYKNLSIVRGILNGLRPVVVALIASAGLSILIIAFWGIEGFSLNLKAIDPVSVGIFIFGLLALRKWKANSTLVIIGSGIIGFIVYSIL